MKSNLPNPMPQFKQFDIVKKSKEDFIMIYGVVGEGVLASFSYDTAEHARDKVGACLFYALSETSSWEIVERDGAKYIPEKWEPKDSKSYFFPDPTLPQLVDHATWVNDHLDRHRMKNGLCFKTNDEAKAKALKMLEAK